MKPGYKNLQEFKHLCGTCNSPQQRRKAVLKLRRPKQASREASDVTLTSCFTRPQYQMNSSKSILDQR